MRIFVLLACVFLCPSAAHAQSRALNTSTGVFSAAAGADWVTTHRGLSHGMRETNPLLVAWKSQPTPTVVVGMAQDAVLVWAVRKVGKRHPTLATVTFYGLSAYRGFLAYRNHRELQKQRIINIAEGRRP